MYEDNSIIFDKLNAASSAVEAAADRCPVFKIIKKLLPKHTVSTSRKSATKTKVENAFKSDKLCGLKLSHNKYHSLIDLISVFPRVLGIACTPDNIESGFIKNGMIDAEEGSRRFPSFNGMFATCKSNPTAEEYKRMRSQLVEYILQYDEYGKADDTVLDTWDIEDDTGPNGEVVRRDSDALHLCRATVVNHIDVRETMKRERKKNRLLKLKTMEATNAKHQVKIDANRNAVYKLLKRAEEQGYVGQDEYDERYLEACTLDTFDVLKLPELKSFIIAHDDKLKKVGDIPNRGNLEEAKQDPPVHNAILMAYNCRLRPNLLDGIPMPHSAEELARLADDDDELPSTEVHVTTVRLGDELDDRVLPSEILSDPLWRANVVKLFNLHKRDEELVARVDPGAAVSEESKATADRLDQILRQRFKKFLSWRIEEKPNRAHWSMKFARNNLPVVAAVMVLSGHLKTDLECLKDRDSLLITDESCFLKCEKCPDEEGAYLYFDIVRKIFVRSGKVAGRGMVVRGDEHLKAAKAAVPTSTMYRLYPSKESVRANNKRDGHFESLIQFVAAGFDPKSEYVSLLDKDYKNGGVFIMSKSEEERIRRSMKQLKCTEKEKFQHMLAYQMELGYDLALAPGDVLSKNPGFESVLGVIYEKE